MNKDGTACKFKFLYLYMGTFFFERGEIVEKWEIVLRKFLSKYENEPFYEGAIACGSYVSGNNNEYSDIDVHIVLKENNEWRERGNVLIDGILVEYFANPVNVYVKVLDEEANGFSNCNTVMFSKGKIIEDKRGKVKMLQEKAKMQYDYPARPLTYFEISSMQYSCWDKFDELSAIYKQNRDSFYLAYYNLLIKLIDFLNRLKGYKDIPITKIDKIIDDKTFRDNYGINNFYEEIDADYIRKCIMLKTKDEMMKQITSFYDYIIETSGGFDINKFVLRSEVK